MISSVQLLRCVQLFQLYHFNSMIPGIFTPRKCNEVQSRSELGRREQGEGDAKHCQHVLGMLSLKAVAYLSFSLCPELLAPSLCILALNEYLLNK